MLHFLFFFYVALRIPYFPGRLLFSFPVCTVLTFDLLQSVTKYFIYLLSDRNSSSSGRLYRSAVAWAITILGSFSAYRVMKAPVRASSLRRCGNCCLSLMCWDLTTGQEVVMVPSRKVPGHHASNHRHCARQGEACRTSLYSDTAADTGKDWEWRQSWKRRLLRGCLCFSPGCVGVASIWWDTLAVTLLRCYCEKPIYARKAMGNTLFFFVEAVSAFAYCRISSAPKLIYRTCETICKVGAVFFS